MTKKTLRHRDLLFNKLDVTYLFYAKEQGLKFNLVSIYPFYLFSF